MIRWYYYICRFCVYWYLRLVTKLTIEGLENIPGNGPLLIVANHLSNTDPPLISVILPRNGIFMAKEELFRNRALGYLVFGLGAFPVHRGQIDRTALRHAERVLNDGQILVMFPESHRSRTGRLQPAYPGSALIAVRHNVPIVAAGITGTEKTNKWSFIFHRYPIRVRFGKPFRLPVPESGKKRADMDVSTRLIMDQIAALLPTEYAGDDYKK